MRVTATRGDASPQAEWFVSAHLVLGPRRLESRVRELGRPVEESEMAELLGAVMSHRFTTVLAIDHGRGDGHSDETLTVDEGLILALLPPRGWFTGQRLLPLMERAEAGR